LRANRLEGWRFRRQQIITGFIVDFYCYKRGLVVEIDGPIHQRQKIEDRERMQALDDLGLKVIRFSNRQVMNHMDQVLEGIMDALNTDSPSRVGKGLGDGS
jgi:very-short-patch-repair endonuclease